MGTETDLRSDQGPRKIDGFDVRAVERCSWEVFDKSTGALISIEGKLLTRLSLDEARGAIYLLESQAVQADRPR